MTVFDRLSRSSDSERQDGWGLTVCGQWGWSVVVGDAGDEWSWDEECGESGEDENGGEGVEGVCNAVGGE